MIFQSWMQMGKCIIWGKDGVIVPQPHSHSSLIQSSLSKLLKHGQTKSRKTPLHLLLILYPFVFTLFINFGMQTNTKIHIVKIQSMHQLKIQWYRFIYIRFYCEIFKLSTMIVDIWQCNRKKPKNRWTSTTVNPFKRPSSTSMITSERLLLWLGRHLKLENLIINVFF